MDNYVKIKVLGKGSYGKAILVQAKASTGTVIGGQSYVVKEIAVHPEKLKEAEQEAEVLRSLSHSNITSFVDSFFEGGGKFVIVMEFADGGDLTSAIERRRKRREPFSEDGLMRIFVQCAMALQHMHARHTLHRDIKSANIFLTATGVVKMGDFGIAKVLDSTMDFAHTQIGTPHFSAPEVFQNKAYSFAADIWSLGCVLYECSTLRLPFDEPTMHKLAMAILRQEPQPLDTWSMGGGAGNGRSLELKSLVKMMLKKRAEHRPGIRRLLGFAYVRSHVNTLLSYTLEKHRGGLEDDATDIEAGEPEAVELSAADQGQAKRSVAAAKAGRNELGEPDYAIAVSAQANSTTAKQTEEETELMHQIVMEAQEDAAVVEVAQAAAGNGRGGSATEAENGGGSSTEELMASILPATSEPGIVEPSEAETEGMAHGVHGSIDQTAVEDLEKSLKGVLAAPPGDNDGQIHQPAQIIELIPSNTGDPLADLIDECGQGGAVGEASVDELTKSLQGLLAIREDEGDAMELLE